MTSGPDKLIRIATALVVVAVAAFAAIVSYSHIFDLGYTHGQQGAAGRLLPLSVDGLILAASLVLLHEARNARSAPPLARVMLWLGIIATVTANVAYGAAYGITGAIISAWPAVAFIGSAEMAMGLVRRARRADPAGRQIPTGSVPSLGDVRTGERDPVPRSAPDQVPAGTAETPSVTTTDASEQPAPAFAVAGASGGEAATRPGATGARAGRTRRHAPRRSAPATPERAEITFAAELVEGNVPSLRAVRREMHVGTDRARELRDHLANVVRVRENAGMRPI